MLLRNVKLSYIFTASQSEHGNKNLGVIKLEEFFSLLNERLSASQEQLYVLRGVS
jgi:hypothetical protein